MRLASGWTRPRPASNCGLRKGRDAFGGFAAGSIADSRPVEKRRSRVDEQVCSSPPLLMVRLPACSPYETSTNRRAGGLGPCLARGGRAACVRPPTCGDWCRFRAAGLGPGASSTCARPRGRGRGGPLGWRVLRVSLVKKAVLRRMENAESSPDGQKSRFAKVEKRMSGASSDAAPAKPQLAAPAPAGGAALFRFPSFAKRNF